MPGDGEMLFLFWVWHWDAILVPFFGLVRALLLLYFPSDLLQFQDTVMVGFVVR